MPFLDLRAELTGSPRLCRGFNGARLQQETPGKAGGCRRYGRLISHIRVALARALVKN
jgi:hypothetical protein